MFRSFRPKLALGTIMNRNVQIENRYVAGAGVGAKNTALRRLLAKKAVVVNTSCINGNLVANGEFAEGTPNTEYIIPPGWELLQGDGNNLILDNVTPSPPSGAARVFALGNLFNKSYLRQRLATVKGFSYTLSYYLLNLGNINASEDRWNESQNLIYFSASVSDENSPLGPVISITYPTSDVGFGWTLVRSTFVAISCSTLLTFTSSHSPYYFYLTSVSVSCA